MKALDRLSGSAHRPASFILAFSCSSRLGGRRSGGFCSGSRSASAGARTRSRGLSRSSVLGLSSACNRCDASRARDNLESAKICVHASASEYQMVSSIGGRSVARQTARATRRARFLWDSVQFKFTRPNLFHAPSLVGPLRHHLAVVANCVPARSGRFPFAVIRGSTLGSGSKRPVPTSTVIFFVKRADKLGKAVLVRPTGSKLNACTVLHRIPRQGRVSRHDVALGFIYRRRVICAREDKVDVEVGNADGSWWMERCW